MALEIKLEAFDGPLDLLLHLIEKNKIDIFDIPIVEITNQYMTYIDEMQTRNMDVMSDFLVMAATLLKIKSKMLLPAEVNEEGEEEDPRAELVERLLEYKLYKYASYELKDKEMDAAHIIYKPSTIPKDIADFREPVDVSAILQDVTLAKLQDVFHVMMKRQIDKIDPIRSKFGKIEKEKVSLKDKMLYIEEYAMLHLTFSFEHLLEQQKGKINLIVTFLGILELMKVGKLKVCQDETFGDIMIEYVPNAAQQEVVLSSMD